jgi:hypothetical protein
VDPRVVELEVAKPVVLDLDEQQDEPEDARRHDGQSAVVARPVGILHAA